MIPQATFILIIYYRCNNMRVIVILLQKSKLNHKLPKLSKGILIIISPFDKKGDIDLGISFIKNILLLNGNYIPNQLIFF